MAESDRQRVTASDRDKQRESYMQRCIEVDTDVLREWHLEAEREIYIQTVS